MISFNKKCRESASFQGITELKEVEMIKIKDLKKKYQKQKLKN